jgi:uncharacterized membrane protein
MDPVVAAVLDVVGLFPVVIPGGFAFEFEFVPIVPVFAVLEFVLVLTVVFAFVFVFLFEFKPELPGAADEDDG